MRVGELKSKPGKAREVCSLLHENVLSTLTAQTGSIDEVVLVSDPEGIWLSASGRPERMPSGTVARITPRSTI
jgi:hypothetical protein